MSKIIYSKNAPKPIGPYSQAVRTSNLIFCSGQIPVDSTTGKIECHTIQDQTKQVIKNIQSVLEEADSDLTKVVKVEVFLSDLHDFKAMNEVYEEFFGHTKPARSTFQVAALPMDSKVEIAVIAEV